MSDLGSNPHPAGKPGPYSLNIEICLRVPGFEFQDLGGAPGGGASGSGSMPEKKLLIAVSRSHLETKQCVRERETRGGTAPSPNAPNQDSGLGMKG